jgi:hypothetical protein
MKPQNITRRLALALLAASTLAVFGCASTKAQDNAKSEAKNAEKTFRFYTVGNSVSDTLNYNAFPKLLEARGYKPVFGRQMIPGAPLEWLWAHPNDGFQVEQFGYPTKAFPNYQWDAISLQPFDRHLDTDTKNISDYIDLALKNPANKNTRFFIYARWPRMSKGGKGVQFDRNNYGKADPDPAKITDYAQIDPWDKLWMRPYTGGWDGSEESAAYFEKLTKTLREKRPDVQVFMIPVGHVMAALNTKMEKGEVPGFKSIWDVYNDGIHLNPVGGYIVGATFFMAFTKENPAGLSSEPYGKIEPTVAKIIQETVWDVVSKHELAGMK